MRSSRTKGSYWRAKQIYEYCEHSTLHECLESFSLVDVYTYIKVLCDSLHVLHAFKILHRDIKPSNFLYNMQTRKGLVIDLGLCELEPEIRSTYIYKIPDKRFYIDKILDLQQRIGKNKFGTEGYMPLETMLMYDAQSDKIDVWAVGVVFLQLVLKKQFVFNNMNLFMYNKDQNRIQKMDNPLAQFVLQLANLYNPLEIKSTCNQMGYFVSVPTNMTGEFDLLKEYIAYKDLDDAVWALIKRCLALKARDRPSVNEVSKVLKRYVS